MWTNGDARKLEAAFEFLIDGVCHERDKDMGLDPGFPAVESGPDVQVALEYSEGAFDVPELSVVFDDFRARQKRLFMDKYTPFLAPENPL